MGLGWLAKIGLIKTDTTSLESKVGAITDDEAYTTINGRLYSINKHLHGRNRSYPFLGAGVTLTGGVGAGAFGAWTEIIPVLANEVNTITITHAADAGGNIVIKLNGCVHTKAVSIGDANAVAAQLRGYTYICEDESWVVSGADAEVIFTRAGVSTTAEFTDVGTTGVTATIVKTNTGAGVQSPFDIHFIQGGIANKKDTYIIELASGLVGYEQRIGNIRISTEADTSAAGMIPMMTAILPLGTRIVARVASLTGGNDTIVVSLNYHMY